MKDHAEDLTHRLLIDAGIGDGMRVLDIGCGRGNVAILAARLAGTRGQVVGIDRDQATIDGARGRARELDLRNLSFERADLSALPSELGSFDAITGQRVLMYQPDATGTLKQLARVLKPGGLMVLQEHCSSSMPICSPAMSLHERTSNWIWQTVARARAPTFTWVYISPPR